MPQKKAIAISNLWKRLDAVLGFLEPPVAKETSELIVLMHKRTQAKKNKDFAEADRLRDAIAAAGWTVQDTPSGPKLKKAATHQFKIFLWDKEIASGVYSSDRGILSHESLDETEIPDSHINALYLAVAEKKSSIKLDEREYKIVIEP
jgi:hypothetical protein